MCVRLCVYVFVCVCARKKIVRGTAKMKIYSPRFKSNHTASVKISPLNYSMQ